MWHSSPPSSSSLSLSSLQQGLGRLNHCHLIGKINFGLVHFQHSWASLHQPHKLKI
uniref:Uncharacterized protein n=1 Tax=Arundo donax TaxID=35708 RepID=A0A0A9B5U7_ARUDO